MKKISVQCENCGMIFFSTEETSICPECGHVTGEARDFHSKCKNCTVPMFICEMCKYREEQPETEYDTVIEPEPITVSVKEEMKPVEVKAKDGMLLVNVRWIGTMLRGTKRAYKYTLEGQSPFHTRVFHDSDGVNGSFYLPEEQWDAQSMMFDMECEACGETYPMMGKKGVKVQCPYCGNQETV
jgi:ribosomal protein S27E